MERQPTLPVTEILAAERQEWSWESAPVPGRWGHPSVADRGREIGDLGMAGLNIGAPARLQRGGRHQHTAGWRFRGAAPHVLRFFREGGLPAAA
jgi:hypothetical protein